MRPCRTTSERPQRDSGPPSGGSGWGAVHHQHCVLWGRALLTSTRDVVSRWGEYFEDLLNPTDMSSDDEAESESLKMGPPISGAEVAKVVKKLLSGRAPGVDEIRPEFLKALDVVGLCWLPLQHRVNIGDSASGLADRGGDPPL